MQAANSLRHSSIQGTAKRFILLTIFIWNASNDDNIFILIVICNNIFIIKISITKDRGRRATISNLFSSLDYFLKTVAVYYDCYNCYNCHSYNHFLLCLLWSLTSSFSWSFGQSIFLSFLFFWWHFLLFVEKRVIVVILAETEDNSAAVQRPKLFISKD